MSFDSDLASLIQWGADAVTLARKYGPNAIDAIKTYGKQAVDALKKEGAGALVQRYGKAAIPYVVSYGVAKAQQMLAKGGQVTDTQGASAAKSLFTSKTFLIVAAGLVVAVVLLRR